MILDTPTPSQTCSLCGYAVDQASSIDGPYRPTEGCLSVCVMCGHVSVFTADLYLREMTAVERDALPVAVQEQLRQLERARLATLRGGN